METYHGMFDIKLQELSRNYSQMQKHISLCQNGDQNKLLDEIQKIKDEIKENDRLLQSRIDNSRCQTVSKLAAAQLEYSKRTKDLLNIDSLSSEEFAALFAEFAIDFASQATRHALLVALYAINKFNEEEKRKEEIYE